MKDVKLKYFNNENFSIYKDNTIVNIANIVIYLMGISELLEIDLEEEVKYKIKKEIIIIN